MKTFVINLPNDKARWRSVSSQLSDQRIDYDRVVGILGAGLSEDALAEHYDAVKASWRQARPLTPSEIGCALSHLVVYRTMIRQDLPRALVLEDDVIIPSEVAMVLDLLEGQMPAEEPIVCLLSPAEPSKEGVRIALGHGYSLMPFGSGHFTSSYALTRAAAIYLLGALHPVGDVADCWKRLARAGVLKIMVVVPTVIEQNQDEFGSTTTADIRAALNASTFGRLQYKLRRVRNLALSSFMEANWQASVSPVSRYEPHAIDDLSS